MSTVLEKPVLLDETGQEIVDKLDEIKSAITSGGEYIPLAIRVTTPPTKTSYYAGDSLDLSGIVVSLVGSNGSLIDVTSQCTFSPANGTVLHASNTSIAITYHYAKDNIDFTTTQNISVADYVAIEVTTPPTKTAYYNGDTLDLTGIVVKLVADDGTKIDVTSQCVFSPANGSTITMTGGGSTENQSISITYHWALENIDFTTTQIISVTAVAATSIAVTTPPTKTSYNVGDTLDLTGIVITATFNNGTSANVTSSCTFSPANGSVLSSDSITAVNITYQSVATTQAITVVYPILGAEWDGSASSAWSRTDGAANFVDPSPALSNGTGSSPFDTIAPWKDIKRITDSVGGQLVEIPKFYYKWTKNGAKLKLQISSFPFDGANVSPAHADRGDGQGERDFIYVGRYNSNNIQGTFYKSVSGVAPMTGARLDAISSIKGTLSSEFYTLDYQTYMTIMMLYLVEFADWNYKSKIGAAIESGNAYLSNTPTGRTDSMQYHTGTTESTRTAITGSTQYRYIENLLGNVMTVLGGIISSGGVRIQNNPNTVPTSEAAAINEWGVSNGNIKAFTPSATSGCEFVLAPSERNTGSDDEYTACNVVQGNYNSDYSYWFAIGKNPHSGGYTGVNNFGVYMGSSGEISAYAGYRIVKLPNNS